MSLLEDCVEAYTEILSKELYIPENIAGCVSVLLQTPDFFAYCEMTPFMLAAKHGDKTLMTNLVKAGADPNLSQKKGPTALTIATRYQNADILAKIIELGGSGSDNSNPMDVVHIAHFPSEVIPFLVKMGYPVTAKAIRNCVKDNNYFVLKLLFKNGAQAAAVGDITHYLMFPEEITTLLECGYDPNHPDYESLLSLSCRSLNSDTVKDVYQSGGRLKEREISEIKDTLDSECADFYYACLSDIIDRFDHRDCYRDGKKCYCYYDECYHLKDLQWDTYDIYEILEYHISGSHPQGTAEEVGKEISQ